MNEGANVHREFAAIRAVFFDAGATLLHPDPPVEEIYAREFSSGAEARFSPADLSRALALAWAEVHAENRADRYGGVRGESEFWRGFLGRVRGHLDGGAVSPEVFARLASHFSDHGSWAVFEDVRGTLAELQSRGVLLAVVSNWDSHLPALLEALGLARSFRAVTVSAIEGTGKPEPEIFRRTCAPRPLSGRSPPCRRFARRGLRGRPRRGSLGPPSRPRGKTRGLLGPSRDARAPPADPSRRGDCRMTGA
jgi:Predicted hydrolase (HAD superfamily)